MSELRAKPLTSEKKLLKIDDSFKLLTSILDSLIEYSSHYVKEMTSLDQQLRERNKELEVKNLELVKASQIKNIIIDPDRFKQILSNYVSNAIKFTPEKGSIQINVVKDTENYFRLEVCDTGIGIRKKDLKKLYIQFNQINQSTSKNYQGTG